MHDESRGHKQLYTEAAGRAESELTSIDNGLEVTDHRASRIGRTATAVRARNFSVFNLNSKFTIQNSRLNETKLSKMGYDGYANIYSETKLDLVLCVYSIYLYCCYYYVVILQ